MQNLVYDFIGRFVWVVVGAAPPAPQPLVTVLAISISPQVERRSCDPKISTGLVDVPGPIRVLNDSFLSTNFSLMVGHSDPRGHRVLSRWQDGPTGSVISQKRQREPTSKTIDLANPRKRTLGTSVRKGDAIGCSQFRLNSHSGFANTTESVRVSRVRRYS